MISDRDVAYGFAYVVKKAYLADGKRFDVGKYVGEFLSEVGVEKLPDPRLLECVLVDMKVGRDNVIWKCLEDAGVFVESPRDDSVEPDWENRFCYVPEFANRSFVLRE